MREQTLFLFEFAHCAAEEFEESIAIEGYAMFKAMHIGFKEAGLSIFSFKKEENYFERFKELADSCEFSLCIAPESEDLLYRLTEVIEKSSSQNLGSSSKAVEIAGDKLRLGRVLGNLSPDTFGYEKISALDFPFVAKLRKGTGGEGLFFIKNEEQLQSFVNKKREMLKNYIFQEYIEGMPCSASLILNKHEGSCEIISAQIQLLNDFKYHGSALPLKITEKIKEALKYACSKIKGLHGYVGVDFVIEKSKEEAKIIEINPRITTSAVAIAYAIGFKKFAEIILKNHLSESFSVPEIKKRIKVEKRRKEGKDKDFVFTETENFKIVLSPW